MLDAEGAECGIEVRLGPIRDGKSGYGKQPIGQHAVAMDIIKAGQPGGPARGSGEIRLQGNERNWILWQNNDQVKFSPICRSVLDWQCNCLDPIVFVIGEAANLMHKGNQDRFSILPCERPHPGPVPVEGSLPYATEHQCCCPTQDRKRIYSREEIRDIPSGIGTNPGIHRSNSGGRSEIQVG